MTYHIIEKQKTKKRDRTQARQLIGCLFNKSKSIDEFKVNADIKNLPKFMVLELVFFYYCWQLKNVVIALTCAIVIPFCIAMLEYREYVDPTQKTDGTFEHMYAIAGFGGLIIGTFISSVLVLFFIGTLYCIRNNFKIET